MDRGKSRLLDSNRMRIEPLYQLLRTNENTNVGYAVGTFGRETTIMTALFETGIEAGAEFSEFRTYRYVLWRTWDVLLHPDQVLMFIGLNPSTADESADDPTIRRCIRFAKDWGYGGLFMMNAYAFRATDPRDMKASLDPIGPGNDEALRFRASQVGMIIAAWGVHCSPGRAKVVCEAIGRPIHCLGKTKDGCPKHPLYLRADTKPELFWEPAAMRSSATENTGETS